MSRLNVISKLLFTNIRIRLIPRATISSSSQFNVIALRPCHSNLDSKSFQSQKDYKQRHKTLW